MLILPAGPVSRASLLVALSLTVLQAQGQPPSAVSVSPSSGSGFGPQTFQFAYSDPDGYANIQWTHMLFDRSLSGFQSCYFYYDRPSNVIYVAADSAAGWAGSATLGSAGTLQNGQCSLNLGSSAASGSGNTLTVSLRITFASTYAGDYNVYLFAGDTEGNTSGGWQQKGAWTVPGNLPPQAQAAQPSSGSGGSQTFTFTYSDPNGYQNLKYLTQSIHPALQAANGCYFFYSPAANAFWLMNDAVTLWLGPITPGTAQTVENSQCTLSAAGMSVWAPNSTTLKFAVPVTFKPNYVGAMLIYQYGEDIGGQVSGWAQTGTWTVPANQPPSAVSVAPSSGSGLGPQTFQFTYSDPSGYANIQWTQMLFDRAVSGFQSCYFYYDRPSNVIYVAADSAAGWAGSAPLGAAGTLQNGQCSLDLGSSSASGSGNTLTVSLRITFASTYAGDYNVYLFAGDTEGNTSGGWQQKGAWTVPGNLPPQAQAAQPSSGSGGSQTFTFTYSDPNGYQNLKYLTQSIHPSLQAANGCYFFHSRVHNAFWLMNDAVTLWLGPITPGTAQTVENSQCTLSAAGMSVWAPNSTTLKFAVPVTFKPNYVGAMLIYQYGEDIGGLVSNWIQTGAWTVPSGNQPPSAASVVPSSGSGFGPQTFQFTYSDPDGYANLASLYGRLNASASDAAACSFRYDRATNYIYLYNDAGSAWLGPVTLGSQLTNSQCTLGAGSTNPNGNNVTLNLTVTFNPSFAGAKNTYMQAVDAASASSGWQTRGTWTVPAGPQCNFAASIVPISEGGKGPPAASGSGCGTTPNCTWTDSSITYVSPAQAYGVSTTFTTGPHAPYYMNFALARLSADGQDLGLACPADATSWGAAVATARVPCNSPTNFYLYAPKLYTLTGFHRSQGVGLDSPVWLTFDSLSFVAAGTSRDFNNLPMGPFSNFLGAGGPTILPGNDGVTVQYTARTVNSVSVRINAPYSARKGRHQLSFPTMNIYGYATANPYFAIVVYDATPAIASVTPNPIPAGAATTLTITGIGFGDHPTVYVAGTAYNPGAPSRNPQGQDVVTVSVTFPLSQAGSPVPVYVVSNGAGGQAFFGAPQGAAQGSPTSATVQVQVAAPPTISGNQGIWWLGAASVNDNCDTGSPVPNCYYNSTQLTLTPGAGGAPPTASSPASWSLTDPLTGQPPTFATYACADGAACSQITVSAAGQPSYCNSVDGNLQARVTLGGISSAVFKVWVNWPQSTVVTETNDVGLPGPPPGYISLNTRQLLSGCGPAMYNIAWHEEFPTDASGNPAYWNVCGQSRGWTVPIPKLPTQGSSGWAYGITDADGILRSGQGDFDAVGYSCDTCAPLSNIPGPFRGQPLDMTANAWSYQFIYVGSQDILTLGKHWPAAPNKQVRYTDHGRVELGTWSCPGP